MRNVVPYLARFQLQPATMRLDNHLTLKHSDAKPGFFCGLKRTEQRAVQKLGTFMPQPLSATVRTAQPLF